MSNYFVNATRSFTFGCLYTLLAGCASYHALELKPADAQHEFESRTLTDPRVLHDLKELLPGEAVPVRWSTAELLIAANDYNPTLAEARLHVSETAAGVETARAVPNPTVSLGSEYDLKQVGEPSWLYSISTSFLLDTKMVRKIRLHLAEAGVRGARLDYAESIWSVRREVRASLLAITIQEQRLMILSAAQQANEQLTKSSAERVREGEAAPSERLQAQLALTRARAAFADAQQKLSEAKAKLATAVGIPIAALDGQALVFPQLDDPDKIDEGSVDALRAHAALARTDLERAIVEYDARDLELREQLRAQYPQVSLGPGYTWDHGIPKATFGIGFTLPIFNLNRGPIGEAAARRASAAQHVMTVQQQALNEIDAAHYGYREQIKTLALARSRHRAAEEAVEQLQRAEAVGAADRPTVLAARISANADALAEVDALERTQTALGQLEDALRTPLNDAEANLQRSSPAGIEQ